MSIKKAGVLIFVLLLFSLNVYAANLTDSYKWLNSQKPTDVYSTAFGALALRDVNGGSSFIQYLEANKDAEGCWPKGACKPKETALAALVMSKENKNIDKSIEWLAKNQDISLTGEWLLQIKTESSGQCDVTYGSQTKKINVDKKGFITSDRCNTPSTFFNLGNCLEQNLLSQKTAQSFEIKCTFSAEISSLYKDSEVYYLNDNVVSGTQAEIKINNGNFDSYEDTLYVNWALKELDNDLSSIIYLRKNFRENDVESSALMFLITENQNYVNELLTLQKEDKSFGDVFDTALAILALKESQHQAQIDQARQWLDLQQKKDGSWNGNILDTSMVLCSSYSNEGIDLEEQKQVTEIPEETETSCNSDNICDVSFGENALQCQNDCSCGDNICDSSESFSSCSKDCAEEDILKDTVIEKDTKKEEERSYGFIWIILLILLLGVGGFFAYKKFFNKQVKIKERPSFTFSRTEPKKTEFKGPFNLLRPVAEVKSEKKSKVELDLENSLKEAKKLLQK